MTSFELISFRLCPFVQRASILLNYKAIDHKTTFIDLADPPAWFSEISPHGQVPLLRVDGRAVLFESAAISEYLDEVTGGALMPSDPFTRAVHRAWIAYSPSVLMPLRDLSMAESAKALDQVVKDFQKKLPRLEEALAEGPFFDGADFSLVDAAYAPLFARLDYFEKSLAEIMPRGDFPKLWRWREALGREEAVENSIGADFFACMDELVAKRQGYLAGLLPPERRVEGPRSDY